ncbi:MAG: hypothetical protein ACRD5Z_05510 [Bryobacteraceae bacterium]
MSTTAKNIATFVEEDDRFNQSTTFPFAPAREYNGATPAPGLHVYSARGFDLGFDSRLPVLSNESPEEALAIGVLSQAAHDLRRYHRAVRGMEREVYLDARSWVIIDDFEWPYSFVNICQILRVSPESMRAELLAEASLGWLGHWVRLSGHLSHLLRDSIARLFTKARAGTSFAPVPSADSFREL